MAETGAASDRELVTAARAGDESAYAELYRRHVGAVRMAVSDNVDDAATRDDLVQEAFIRALAAIDQLHDPDKFRPWLLQIARHAAIDDRRRRRTVPIDSIDDDDAPQLLSVDPGPVELTELHDLAGRVRSGLARMSPRDALVLSLSAQFGFGISEIANALGITRNNAKVVLHRARRRLRLAVELEAAGELESVV